MKEDLIQLIMMGKFIRQIWVKCFPYNLLTKFMSGVYKTILNEHSFILFKI